MTKGDLVLPLSRVPLLSEFLDTLRIKPGSFAAQLFATVYEDIFARSKDLRQEYDSYYCVEYATFEKYLELAHEICLDPTELGKAHILKVETPGGLLDEAYEENVTDAVIDCILILEDGHEG